MIPSPNTSSCLVDEFPEVAAEWHPTRNGERSPSWVTPGSKYRAWWLCSVCGSEWQARVGSRTRGHGCPSCGRELAGRSHAVPKPGTSLAEWFPDVAAEWHPTRNGDLTPDLVGYASNKKVWWRCRDCQHEWQIQVSNRSRGSSCRRCAHRALARPKPGNSLLRNGSHRSPRNGIPAATKQPLQPAPVTVPNAEFGGNAPTADTSGQPPSATEPMAVPAVLYAETDQARNCANVADRRTTWLVLRGGTPPGVRPSIGMSPQLGDTFLDRFPAAAAEWHPTKNEET